MQSRVFSAIGKGGKTRPMFMGQWTDLLGEKHYGGMADYLLTPRITISLDNPVAAEQLKTLPAVLRDITTVSIRQEVAAVVPLWVECKAGSGRLSSEQKLFRDYILQTHGEYLLIENNPELLLEWFKKFGVAQA